jgi:hypothetical protein
MGHPYEDSRQSHRDRHDDREIVARAAFLYDSLYAHLKRRSEGGHR